MLLEGRSYKQMMAALQVDFGTINRETYKIYKSHGVSGRKGLARKLGATILSIHSERRERVLQLLLEGAGYDAIASAIGVNRDCVHHHAKMIYLKEGVSGWKELAAHLSRSRKARRKRRG